MKVEAGIVIVINSKKELFVCQRKADKKAYPLMYQPGSGGKIEEGETPLEGAKRELKEEFGIEPEIEYVGSMPYDMLNFDEFAIHVYKAHYDGPIDFCKKEFISGRWMSLEEFDKLSRDGKVASDIDAFYRKYKKKIFDWL